MKKNYFSSLTYVFLCCLLLIGCGSNPNEQMVYKAEKMMYDAEQLYNKATIKPDLADKYTWAGLKDAYNATLAYCWENIGSISGEDASLEKEGLESVAFMATSRVSSIYYAEGKFDSAVVVLEKLLAQTKLTDRPLLSSKLNLARAYFAGGDWISGIDIYKSILSTFYPPLDSDNKILADVLNLPMEMLSMGIRVGNIPKGFEGAQNTIDYYSRMISDWPGTELGKAARRKLADLYVGYKKWDDAIANLEQITDSTGATGFYEAVRIGDIYGFGKGDHKKAIEIFEGLLDGVKDTSTIATLYKKIGIAQYEDKQYENCRKTLLSIKDNYNNLYMTDPTAQKYIALSYVKEGNWDRAEKEYQWLVTNYSDTEEAFEAYLTIADHYSQTGNQALKERWYGKADEFYAEKQLENPGTQLEASAISYRAEVARRQENWDVAAQRLEELFKRFPDEEVGQRALANAIALYRDKLNNAAKADSLQKILNPGT